MERTGQKWARSIIFTFHNIYVYGTSRVRPAGDCIEIMLRLGALYTTPQHNSIYSHTCVCVPHHTLSLFPPPILPTPHLPTLSTLCFAGDTGWVFVVLF